MEVENGSAETATKAAIRFRMSRFDVVPEDGNIVTILATVRAKRYSGISGAFT
jgi:hypothetical protein